MGRGGEARKGSLLLLFSLSLPILTENGGSIVVAIVRIRGDHRRQRLLLWQSRLTWRLQKKQLTDDVGARSTAHAGTVRIGYVHVHTTE